MSATKELIENCQSFTKNNWYSYGNSLQQLNNAHQFVMSFGTNFEHFFSHKNSCQVHLMLSEKYGDKNCLYENISRNDLLNPYFNLNSEKLSDEQISEITDQLKENLLQLIPNMIVKFFIKDASNNEITSLHFIAYLYQNKKAIYIKNKEEMKNLFLQLNLREPFDINFYNNNNIRMLYSNKFDQQKNQWTNRKFRTSYQFSSFQNDVYSLVTKCTETNFVMLSDIFYENKINYLYHQPIKISKVEQIITNKEIEQMYTFEDKQDIQLVEDDINKTEQQKIKQIDKKQNKQKSVIEIEQNRVEQQNNNKEKIDNIIISQDQTYLKKQQNIEIKNDNQNIVEKEKNIKQQNTQEKNKMSEKIQKLLKNKPKTIKFSEDSEQLRQVKSKKIILWNGRSPSYFGLDSYGELLRISKAGGELNMFCENAYCADKVCPYIDLDIEESNPYYKNYNILTDINKIDNSISFKFPFLYKRYFIKYCEGNTKKRDNSIVAKKSFHIIIRLYYKDIPVYIQNCNQALKLLTIFQLEQYADQQAYKGNLRLLFSDKWDRHHKKLDGRIFQIHPDSDFQDTPIMSLMTYCPDKNNQHYMLDELIKKNFMISQIQEQSYENQYKIEDIRLNLDNNYYYVYLQERRCPKRDHQSNNSSAMYYIDSNDFIIKCEDQECQAFYKLQLNYKDFTIQEQQNKENQKNNHQQQQQEKEMCDDDKIKNCLYPEFYQESKYRHGIDTINTIFNNELFNINSQGLLNKIGQDIHKNFDNEKEVSMKVDKNQIEFMQDQEVVKRINRQMALNMVPYLEEFLQGKLKPSQDIYIDNSSVTNIFNNYGVVNNTQKLQNEKKVVGQKELEELYDTFDAYFQEFPEVQQLLKEYIFDNKDTLIEIVPIVQSGRFVHEEGLMYYYNEKQSKWTLDKSCDKAKIDFRKLLQNIVHKIQQSTKYNEDMESIMLHKSLKGFNNRINSYSYQQYAHLLAQETDDGSSIFDRYTNLIHFKNTVYDFNQQSFIDNDKIYYNRHNTNYVIQKNINFYNEQIIKLNKILSDIFPESQTKDWFLNKIGCSLNPQSIQKPLIFMKGVGKNGKSIMIQLIQKTLGSYASTGSSALFQEDTIKDSNKVTGPVNQIINSRVCLIEEIKSSKIDIELLKRLTGGGEQSVRSNYGDWVNKLIYCQFFIACNQLPDWGGRNDNALKNRIQAIEFKTSFVPNPQFKHQKPENKNIINIIKDPLYIQAFMMILLEKQKLQFEDLPQEIEQFTQNVREQQDKYLTFFEQKIRIVESIQSKILKNELVEEFVDYWNEGKMSTQAKNMLYSVFEEYLHEKGLDKNYQGVRKQNKRDTGWKRVEIIHENEYQNQLSDSE